MTERGGGAVKVIWNKRINTRKGFSLAETLIVVLILLMVSGIVAAALPTAANVFTKTVDSANAQVLLSTTVTVLRDELSTIKKIYPGNSGSEIEYENAKGSRKLAVITKVSEGGTYPSGIDGPGIWVYPTSNVTGQKYGNPVLLVSPQAATSGMYVNFTLGTDVSKGVVNISGIKVIKDDPEKPLATQNDFSIRIVGKAELPPAPSPSPSPSASPAPTDPPETDP